MDADTYDEIQAELTELRAEIVRLRAALKPFADYAERLDSNYTTQGYPDACPVAVAPGRAAPTVGDLRQAWRLLEQSAPPVTNGPPCHPESFWTCSTTPGGAAGTLRAACSVCGRLGP